MSFLTQGRMIQLDHLQSMAQEFLGEEVQPEVCVECYCERDECSCPRPLYWPLPSAILKLQSELGR